MNGNSIRIVSEIQIVEKEKNTIFFYDIAVVVRIEIGSLERQLISCSNANTVRKLLVKLASTNPSKPLWTVNPSWEIATPLKSLLMSLQRGFLQDFAYVLLGKARELTAKRVNTNLFIIFV